FESPLSGMSMNPARSFASAAPGMQWQYFWIYVTAPVLGMLIGAEIFLVLTGARRALCAEVLHPLNVRCIQCGYELPVAAAAPTPSPLGPRSAQRCAARIVTESPLARVPP